MMPRAPQSPTKIQLNLPLLQEPTCVVPDDSQAELILALVELLIGAAQADLKGGGDDESEVDR